METVFMLIAVLSLLAFIVGMFTPQTVGFKSRGKVTLVYLGVFFISSAIGSSISDNNIIPQNPIEETLIDSAEIDKSDTIGKVDTIQLSLDSLLLITYPPKFNELYADLMKLDSIEDEVLSRGSFHSRIQKLFDDWFESMESTELLGEKVPLSRKEYDNLFRKYDKQFARFMLYGNEDRESIKFWAESNAKTILREVAVDPESLVIERVSCNGKTNKGWKCTVVYRARNGFGGYVRESITLIMAYDMDNSAYICVDVS